MNERGLKIIKELTEHPEYRINELSEQLGLTKRQVNYAIKQINEQLEALHFSPISRNFEGVFVIEHNVIQHYSENDLQKGVENDKTRVYTPAERLYLLQIYFLMGQEYISLAHLQQLTSVSKTTVMADLKQVETYMEKYRLKLAYSRKDGYLVLGNEKQIRLALNETISNFHYLKYKANAIHNRLAVKDVYMEEVIHLVTLVEYHLNINYSDAAVEYLQHILFFTLHRMNNSRYDKSFFLRKVNQTVEYCTVKKILEEMKHVYLPCDIEWITLIFLSANIYRQKDLLISEEDKIVMLARQMIKDFERKTLVTIYDTDKFLVRLLGHLRPACFRVQYGLKIAELGLEKITQNNSHIILLELMQELIKPLERYLGQKFPLDELELLSFYFGSEMNAAEEESATKKRAVVVCTNGVIISKLLFAGLQKLFPEIHFLSNLSVREFHAFQHDYDMVFTNITLDTVIKQYVIGSLSTYSEQIQLRYRVLKDIGYESLDTQMTAIIDLIQKSGYIENEEHFKEELKLLMYEGSSREMVMRNTKLPHLHKYIKKKYIKFEAHNITWKEAIRIACEPLLLDNVISKSYIEELIYQYEANVTYSYLGEIMAIPHATTEMGVFRDGMGLLITKNNVVFPDNRSIRIIVPIAIKNEKIHLHAINQLSNWSVSKELTQQIEDNFNDVEGIHKIIEAIEKGG